MSLLLVADFITKSDDTLLNLPNSVPLSCKIISALSASKIMSPATSKVKSPDAKSISVPSIVMLSIITPPFAVTVDPNTAAPVISTASAIVTFDESAESSVVPFIRNALINTSPVPLG